METTHFLEPLAARFGQNASVRNVYGEPFLTRGKTIIPVAKIAMGLGGGYGHNGKPKGIDNSDSKSGEGAGGGGGMIATAKGVYEITDQGTKFIPANATMKLLGVGAIAFLAGRWFGSRKKQKQFIKSLKA